MKKILKKIIAASIVVSFSFAQVAFAQEASSSPVATDQTITVPATSPASSNVTDQVAPPVDDVTETASTTMAVDPVVQTTSDVAPVAADPNVNTQASSSVPVVQDTANTQTAVTGDTLEDTTNPQTATSTTEDIVPLVDASSSAPTKTPIVGTTAAADSSSTTTTIDAVSVVGTATTSASSTQASSISDGSPNVTRATPIDDTSALDVVAENVDANVVVTDNPATQAATQADTVTAERAVEIPVEELTPKPEYEFALTGKEIPTVVKGKTVAEPLTPVVDNASGVVSVSGACHDTYFVVLLFKNQNDYSDDPRSYIVNRAYPCVNNTFSYSISELPTSLADGTYYLLVGQEADRGPWTPITGLTEITINRNQQ